MFGKTRMFLFVVALVALIASFIPGEVADDITLIAFIVMAVGWMIVANQALNRVKRLEWEGSRNRG